MLKNKINKKLILSFFLIFAVFLILPTIASAHVLKTDGSIGAVVHIDPDDDPIIGKSANFFLEFKDTKNKFQLANSI